MSEELNDDVPINWAIKELGEICFTTSGGTPSRKIPSYYNGSIPWVKSGELDKGLIVDTEEKISGDAVKNSSAKVFPKGTLLIALYGATIGKIGFLGVDAATNQAICGIFKNDVMNLEFLKYYLFHKRHYLIEQGAGGAQPNISQTILKKTPIPIPPLPEQHRIVAKIEELFSSLDKGIENLKTAQAQLKTYRQAVLKYAFEGKLTNENVKDGDLPEGWKWVKIGDVCKCIVPNRDKPKSFSGNIKWITTPNLSEKSIKIDYKNITMGLSDDEVHRYNARIIPVGSVIMTCVGNFGISAIVEEKIVINQQLHAFICNEIINTRFLAYCIQFNKNYFEKKSTSTTIQYLNKNNCNSMPFPLCPFPEQHRIVSEIETRLSVCDKLEESITQSLLQAEALRQSILKKAFEGKLVPQDPNDEPASALLERIRAERESVAAKNAAGGRGKKKKGQIG